MDLKKGKCSESIKNLGEGGIPAKLYMNVPAEPQESDFIYTSFLLNYPPISIPLMIEKHPILPKFGVFYYNLLKILPINYLGSFVSDVTHDRYAKFCEKSAPKGSTFV